MSPGKLGQKRPTIASTVVAYLLWCSILPTRKSEIDISHKSKQQYHHRADSFAAVIAVHSRLD